MALTPNDILDKRFPTRFRGYDPKAVRPFLEEVAATLANAVREQNVLKDRLTAYENQLSALREKEREFREALTSAHRLIEEMKGQAERESQMILERARLDAERIVADGHQEAIQLEGRIRGLRRLEWESSMRMRSTLEHFLRLVDEEELPPEGFEQAMEAVASEARALQGPHGPRAGGEHLRAADLAPDWGHIGSPSTEEGGARALEGPRMEESSGEKVAGTPSPRPTSDLDIEKIWPSE